MIEFAPIEKVNLREIWKHEEHDFTPWLAENISKLGDAIGLELAFKEKEVLSGSFELDILATDLGRDRIVVIENQLEATDHSHLGQLLTYAAWHKAEVIIWLSKEVREAHRASIDWLNSNTSENIEFFAIEVEVLKIGNSQPALNFKLKSFPNDWQKSNTKISKPSDIQNAYQDFFQKLIDDLRDNHRFTNAKKGQPQSWYSFSSGLSGLIYSASFAKDNRLRAELYIDTGKIDLNKSIFDKLLLEKEAIEKAFGKELSWERLDDKRASRVAIYSEGKISDDAEKLELHKNWFIANLRLLKDVLNKRCEVLIN
ncbi:MAG: DUF4268 domain-containing protein [Bacteroidia bacterium]